MSKTLIVPVFDSNFTAKDVFFSSSIGRVDYYDALTGLFVFNTQVHAGRTPAADYVLYGFNGVATPNVVVVKPSSGVGIIDAPDRFETGANQDWVPSAEDQAKRHADMLVKRAVAEAVAALVVNVPQEEQRLIEAPKEPVTPPAPAPVPPTAPPAPPTAPPAPDGQPPVS